MIDPFKVNNRGGEPFAINCVRHNDICWRLVITSPGGEYAGDMTFEPQDMDTMKIIDFHIHPEFSAKGLGTNVMGVLLNRFRERGFCSVIGICKSYDHPLSEKEKLAEWYARLGFTLIREDMATEPGYMGRLFKRL